MVATTEAYSKINRLELARGRFLRDGEDQSDEGDAQRLRNVVVLGSGLAKELFPFEEAVGQTVAMNKAQYLIVGVLKDRISHGSGDSEENFNNDIYMPIRTCRVRFGERLLFRQGSNVLMENVELHQITLTVAETDQVRDVGAVVTEQLKRTHPRKDWHNQ